MNSTQFIFAGDEMIHVAGNADITASLVPGKGYTHGGYVWVYTDNFSGPKKVPLVYKDSGENLCYEMPAGTSGMRDWSEENIRENTTKDAESVTKSMISISSEMIEAMNSATSSYKPIVNDDDDFLKKIIKSIILLKGVDLNRLKTQMDKVYGLSNLKSALKGKTKMSVVGFLTWSELLGVTFDITVTDLGIVEGLDTMGSPLKYSRSVDKVFSPSGEEVEPETKYDDFLKRVVKATLLAKGIDLSQDLSNLKSRMNKAYGLSNLKSALRGPTKMSVVGFLTWMDLLGVVVQIDIFDNGQDRIDPLPEPMMYRTDTDKVTNANGEPFKFREDDE